SATAKWISALARSGRIAVTNSAACWHKRVRGRCLLWLDCGRAVRAVPARVAALDPGGNEVLNGKHRTQACSNGNSGTRTEQPMDLLSYLRRSFAYNAWA